MLGSQIFDYWYVHIISCAQQYLADKICLLSIVDTDMFDDRFDGSGNVVEHYVDGDLVNEDTPERRIPAGPDSLFVWGPDLPLAFVTTRLEDVGTQVVLPPDALEGKPAKFEVDKMVKM